MRHKCTWRGGDVVEQDGVTEPRPICHLPIRSEDRTRGFQPIRRQGFEVELFQASESDLHYLYGMAARFYRLPRRLK